MDKKHLFDMLKEQNTTVLIELLEKAYEEMTTNQKRSVFGTFAENMPPVIIKSEVLFNSVGEFYKKSLAGVYYAPFNINSQNFMDIPEETDQWFELLGDYLEQSCLLSEQGDHKLAIQCFTILYELIDLMEDGDEIVFADELGSWMIPIDEKSCLHTYISSLSATLTPETFTTKVIPLLHRDSFESLANKVYPTIKKIATKAQRKLVDEEVARQKIRIKSDR